MRVKQCWYVPTRQQSELVFSQKCRSRFKQLLFDPSVETLWTEKTQNQRMSIAKGNICASPACPKAID